MSHRGPVMISTPREGDPVTGSTDDALVPDIALRLRCPACGAGPKDIETRPDFTGRGIG